MRAFAFISLLVLVSAGCGYRGPLYLPETKPGAVKPAPPAPAVPPQRPQPSEAVPPVQ